MTQKKKFEHNEIEQCKLSKKNIDTLKDDYSIILDCRGEEIKSVGFYKTDLLKDLVKEKGEKVLNALQQRTMGVAEGMLQRFGLIKKQYEVK